MEDLQKRNIIGERVRTARETSDPKITQKDLSARLQILGADIVAFANTLDVSLLC